MRLRAGRAPVAPLREAFERSGVSGRELALRLGWERRANPGLLARRAAAVVPDEARVRRVLGLSPTVMVKGGKRYSAGRRTLPREQAEAIARALHVDPWEVGL